MTTQAGYWHDDTPLESLLAPKEAKAFEKNLGYETAEDLLWHLPRQYVPHGSAMGIDAAEDGDIITFIATVQHAKITTTKANKKLYTFELYDGQRTITATFFNSHYITGVLTIGTRALFSGKLKIYKMQRQVQHPDYVVLNNPDGSVPKRQAGNAGLRVISSTDEDEGIIEMLHRLPILPIYPASKNLPTWRILAAVQRVLGQLAPIEDPLGPFAPASLPSFDAALRELHHPKHPLEQGVHNAIQRLKYDEALRLVTVMELRRQAYLARTAPALPAKINGHAEQLRDALPYELTDGQEYCVDTIAQDLAKTHPMQRLLQGEVGSGKTVVALMAMLQAVDAGYQAALLAPTEVLAQQHAQSLSSLLRKARVPVRVTVLTGGLNTAEKRQALLDIVSGEADIIVGTHALVQEHVDFFKLGLCIVDEQHRFGVEQRDELRNKGPEGITPHQLVMTATPIPRSIAMTVFGDLQISMLTELPGGRKPIESHVIQADRQTWVDRMWRRLDEELEQGHQAYVVCPRIDKEGGVGAVTEALQRRFPHRVVAGLHGAMHPELKNRIMGAFADGQIQILVSTTVIEVGIDVPNATVMVVLESEHFGVSQLHQLRGRIGRGGNASICFFHTNSQTESPAYHRVSLVAEHSDGFLLAEYDLECRQEGNVLGVSQAGNTQQTKLLRLARDREIIAQAQLDAAKLVAQDRPRAIALVEEIAGAQQAYLEKS